MAFLLSEGKGFKKIAEKEIFSVCSECFHESLSQRLHRFSVTFLWSYYTCCFSPCPYQPADTWKPNKIVQRLLKLNDTPTITVKRAMLHE